MKDYIRHVILLVKRLLLALLLFFVARVFFLVLNYAHFTAVGFTGLLKDFIIGARFDLSVIFYMNLPVILLHIIPGGKFKKSKAYQKTIKYYFVVVNSLLLLINLADARFFDFTLKRSTAYILGYLADSGELMSLLPRFIVSYWYVPLVWIAFTLVIWYLYPRLPKDFKTERITFRILAYQLFSFVILLGLTVLVARGGTQPKPLAVIHASMYVPAKEVPLVLNTPFAIMTTYGHQLLIQKKYFPDEVCEQIFPVVHRYEYTDTSFRKMNVVILLLESFSREYSGYLNDYKGYMPFLDSLMQQSYILMNAYANGSRSIDAVPATVSGIPCLMNDPFTVSVYNTNKIGSLAKILKREGYETAFFHGGNNGTMSFDAFSEMAGFDAYYGHTEYDKERPGNDDYDGYWGIYDDAFLDYMAHKLNSFKQPFFAFEFTLSSHSPYDVPKEYVQMFPETPVPLLRVVRYSDYALRKFFETASAMPWFENTLFVILADHPGHSVTAAENERMESGLKLSRWQLNYYKNTAGRYAIPMLFYAPGDGLTGSASITAQQTDVMPSVLDYLNYNKPFMAFGSSVFDSARPHVAFGYMGGFYQLIQGDYTLLFDGEASLSLYNNREDPEHLVNLLDEHIGKTQEMETLIKAVVQQYNHRMENNLLFSE